MNSSQSLDNSDDYFKEKLLTAMMSIVNGKLTQSRQYPAIQMNSYESNQFLQEYFDISESWNTIINVLACHQAMSPEVCYFASNFLYMKSKKYWSQISVIQRESALQYALNILWASDVLNKNVSDRIILAICNLASRVPNGISKILEMSMQSMQSFLMSVTVEGNYHFELCINLISSVPDEYNSVDISRRLRLEINDTLQTFTSNYLMFVFKILETAGIPMQTKYKAINSTLGYLSINKMNLTEFFEGYRPLFDLLCHFISIHEIGDKLADHNDMSLSYNLAIYRIFHCLLSQFDEKVNQIAVNSLFNVFTFRFNKDSHANAIVLVDISLFTEFVDLLVEVILFQLPYLSQSIVSSNYEINHVTALQNDAVVEIANILLFIFSSNHRKISLLTLEVWINLSDIDMNKRHNYLQRDIYRELLSISIQQSKYKVTASFPISLNADELMEVEEFRHAETGVIDILRLCYFSLGKREYLKILISLFYPDNILNVENNRFLSSLNSGTFYQIWNEFEVIVFHIQLYVMFVDDSIHDNVEDIEDVSQSQVNYNDLIQLICDTMKIITFLSHDNVIAGNQNHVQNFKILEQNSLFQSTIISFISKISRLVVVTQSHFVSTEVNKSSQIFHQYLSTCLDMVTSQFSLQVIQVQRSRDTQNYKILQLILKSVTAIVSNWLPHYTIYCFSCNGFDAYPLIVSNISETIVSMILKVSSQLSSLGIEDIDILSEKMLYSFLKYLLNPPSMSSSHSVLTITNEMILQIYQKQGEACVSILSKMFAYINVTLENLNVFNVPVSIPYNQQQELNIVIQLLSQTIRVFEDSFSMLSSKLRSFPPYMMSFTSSFLAAISQHLIQNIPLFLNQLTRYIQMTSSDKLFSKFKNLCCVCLSSNATYHKDLVSNICVTGLSSLLDAQLILQLCFSKLQRNESLLQVFSLLSAFMQNIPLLPQSSDHTSGSSENSAIREFQFQSQIFQHTLDIVVSTTTDTTSDINIRDFQLLDDDIESIEALFTFVYSYLSQIYCTCSRVFNDSADQSLATNNRGNLIQESVSILDGSKRLVSDILFWCNIMINEYSHDEKLIRSILRLVECIFTPISISTFETVFEYNLSSNVTSSSLDEMISTLILTCILQVSINDDSADSSLNELLETASSNCDGSSMIRSKAVDILYILTTNYVMKALDNKIELKDILSYLTERLSILMNHGNSRFTIYNGSSNNSFDQSTSVNLSLTIAQYVLHLMVNDRPNSNFNGRMKRRLKQFFDDLHRVYHRQLEVETLQDFFIGDNT